MVEMAASSKAAVVLPPAAGPLVEQSAKKAAVVHHDTESPLAKFFISGLVSWIFELFCGNALEFVKIAKQTSNKPYLTIVLEVTGKKGVLGFLDGFFPWGTLQAIAKGAVFGWGHATCRTLIDGMVSDHAADVISGGVGGGVQGLVLSPLLLLKTRVMTDPSFRSQSSLLETTIQSARVGVRVIRHEGYLGLMKGSMVFSGKRVIDWTSRFYFVDMCEVWFKRYGGDPKRNLSLSEQSTAAMVGGAISAVVTLPLDVLVAQIQQASKAGKRQSIAQMFGEQMKEGGISSLIAFSARGMVIRVIHVGLTTLMMKTISSYVYGLYNGFRDRVAETSKARRE